MIAAIIKKISSVTRFFLLAAGLFGTLAVALIFISNSIIRQSFLTRVKNATSRNIQLEAQNLLTAGDFTSGDAVHAKNIFNTLFQAVKTAEIIRIKVWDTESRVIFSDDETIVGQRFTDNSELQRAIKGEVVAELQSPVKPENISEQGYVQLVSLYVPILFPGRPNPGGVIEAYFRLDNINAQINETQKILIITIVSLISLSFVLFFVLFQVVVSRETDFLRKVIDTSPDLIFVKDWNGRFTLVNKATADIYNTTVENLLGKTDADFNDNKDEVANFLAADRQVIRSLEPKFIKEEPVSNAKTREERWFQTLKVPIFSGRAWQVLGVSADITERKKGEEQIRLHTAALESAENVMLITDRNGLIQWVNPAFIRLTGYTWDEAIGKTPRLLKSGKQTHEYYKALWDTILAGQPWRSEVTDRRKDGSLYTVDQIITPVKDDHGNVINFVAIQQDISERILAEEKLSQANKNLEDSRNAMANVLLDLRVEKANTEKEKAKDEAMLASIGEGLIAVDTEGKIMIANKIAEDMLDWIQQDLKGKTITSLPLEDEIGHPVPLKSRPTTIALSTSERTNGVYYFVRKDKTRFPLSITVTPIKLEGKIIGLVEIIRDVTREREIDRAKSEFVSLASHQLRTPLSTIGWYTEMLLSGDGGAITDKQKNYLDEIYGGNKRMVDLVNSLLNVSRIESGSFGIEPSVVVVKDVIDAVLKDLAVDLTSKKISVDVVYDYVTMISADPKLLTMILQNLLSNAERYTAIGGSIHVRVSRSPAGILFTITDTGIGIPRSSQEKIFTKMYRADNARSMRPNGSGLGLYMVKSILERAGGSIRFVSEEGKGTTFYVTIPLTGMKEKKGDKVLIV